MFKDLEDTFGKKQYESCFHESKQFWPLWKLKSLEFSVLATIREKEELTTQQSIITTEYWYTSEGFKEELCNTSQQKPHSKDTFGVGVVSAHERGQRGEEPVPTGRVRCGSAH